MIFSRVAAFLTVYFFFIDGLDSVAYVYHNLLTYSMMDI